MTQAEVLTDTLQGVAGAVTTGNFQESDVWFYIAMVEFVIIFFLLLFGRHSGWADRSEWIPFQWGHAECTHWV